jgi:hypothetical protein
MRGARVIMIMQSGAGAHIDYVGNRMPFPIELAQLLWIYVQHQSDLMIVGCRLGLHRRQVESAPRSRVQNPH